MLIIEVRIQIRDKDENDKSDVKFINENKTSVDENIMDKNTNDENNRFSMVLPPPNVTGSLHLGRAIVRYNRMLDKSTLCIPAISTQSVVEKMIAKQGIICHELGREKFIEQVHKWKDEYDGHLMTSLSRE